MQQQQQQQDEEQQGGDSNNTEDRLSLNIEFTDNDNCSLDSIDNIGKMRYQSERQTSILQQQQQQQQQQVIINGINGINPMNMVPMNGMNGMNGMQQSSLSRNKSKSGGSPKLTSSFLTSGPRLNYEEEGLSAAHVEEVLSQLEIHPDPSTDIRPVFSCIRPIVCHKSNTPFYAQCSTAKLGYCTWCRQLRRGNQKQGSVCLNCGERLTAKYHRWYPHLIRLEPLEKTRTKSMYIRYKPVFERFGITWHNDKQFDFVIDHYMLMKIYLSTKNFNIDALHLERTYMIGVFAGREFNTGAMARKLLREGTKLAMFTAVFPHYYHTLRDERVAVAQQMNLRFFKGIYKCYFHAHYTNIEGWYDPSVISRESIMETFKEEVYNNNNRNGQTQQPMMNMIPNGMNMMNVNQNGIPNGMNQIAINQMNQMQLNGAAVNNVASPLSLVNGNQLQQQQQQQQYNNNNHNNNKNNQLLVATQSMLNGIQLMPPPSSMISNPLNQISVTNMPAITPIATVKTFQFNNPSVGGNTPQKLIWIKYDTQIN